MECTFQQKIASRRGNCELAHSPDVISMISSSTIPAFASLGPSNGTFDQRFDPQAHIQS